MTQDNIRVLLIGFGNPGRKDDGLGPALAAAVEKMGLADVTVESNYQLNVEDSDAIAKHDVVIFADASVNCKEPYEFERLAPQAVSSFSSHSIEPRAVLALAHQLFQAKTTGFMLAIRGYEYNEFEENLSDAARENLQKAVAFVEEILQDRKFLTTEVHFN
ncbi:MAG: hydrogenase maturation protease [Candidatus Sumerlaeia bacterium]